MKYLWPLARIKEGLRMQAFFYLERFIQRSISSTVIGMFLNKST
jgi:hypothetical protein